MRGSSRALARIETQTLRVSNRSTSFRYSTRESASTRPFAGEGIGMRAASPL